MPPKKTPTRPRPRKGPRPGGKRTASAPRRREGVPADLTDAARGERLHKALADAGVASRRECEQFIRAGRVTVNGELVTALPAWIDPQRDRVVLDGEPVKLVGGPRRSGKAAAASGPDKRVYLMLNKPRRVVSTTRDPQGRKTVIDLIAPAKGAQQTNRARLYPVGRLDAESTGLMLLTNDGELANRLTHPRYGVTKQYQVSVRGALTEQDAGRLTEGLVLAHRTPKGPRTKKAAMAQVKRLGIDRDRSHGDRTKLLVTLREGQNREVRRMLARLGHKVRRLHRVAIGPLQLKGLAVGEWRALTGIEVERLRRAAKQAGP